MCADFMLAFVGNREYFPFCFVVCCINFCVYLIRGLGLDLNFVSVLIRIIFTLLRYLEFASFADIVFVLMEHNMIGSYAYISAKNVADYSGNYPIQSNASLILLVDPHGLKKVI